MNSGKTGGPLFGTGIVPVSAKSSPNQAGIECIAKLGSGHMELLKALKNPKARGGGHPRECALSATGCRAPAEDISAPPLARILDCEDFASSALELQRI
jgi:hypothetical protein